MKRLPLFLAVLGLIVGGLGLGDAEYLRHQLNERITAARAAVTQLDRSFARAGRQAAQQALDAAVCQDWPAYTATVTGPFYKATSVSQQMVQTAATAVGQIGQDLDGVTGVHVWTSDLHTTWTDLGTANADWDTSSQVQITTDLDKVDTDLLALAADDTQSGVRC